MGPYLIRFPWVPYSGLVAATVMLPCICSLRVAGAPEPLLFICGGCAISAPPLSYTWGRYVRCVWFSSLWF